MAERETADHEQATTAAAGAIPAQRSAPPEPAPSGAGPAPTGPARPRGGWRRVFVLLALFAVLLAVLALCLVSADQKLKPHNLPFGVTGSSPVTSAVTSKLSLTLTTYPDQAAAEQAVDDGEIYGAYIPGGASDTLVIAPQKSFFGAVILTAAFEDAARSAGRTVTVDDARPLPLRDRTGSVTGLLLLPLLIGGVFVPVFVLQTTRRVAARWRVAILLGYAVVGALVTDLIAGLAIGAYPSDRFWPLLPVFALIIGALAVSTATIQRLAGRLGTLIVLIVFVVVGLPSAGGLGLSLLPVFWQTVGTALPPQHAVTLIRNTLYFGSSGLTVPLLVLGAYLLAGAVVLGWFDWFRDGRPRPAAPPPDTATAAPRHAAGTPSPRRAAAVATVAGLAVALFVQTMFSTTYMSSGHSPVAERIPVGVVGTSPLVGQVQQQGYSMAVHQYSSEAAAQQAIDQGELFGVLVPGTASTPDTLLVVPTQSDLAPLDLADQFERAATATGQLLQVKPSEPTPLASGDPYGIVLSLMLVPLLLGGYITATALTRATATASAPGRVAALLGFAVVAGLLVCLVVGLLLDGFPSDKFWLVWPIASLTIAVAALVGSLLLTLLGPAGGLLTAVVIVWFGNPSSGGANGVPYLPGFWRDLGPYLPPRNAYLLLRNTVYFDGHGIAPYLWVLLGYAVVAGVASSLLGWFRTPRNPVPAETETDATAMMSAAAAAPP